MSVAPPGQFQESFKGLTSPPLITGNEKGIEFTLTAPNAGTVQAVGPRAQIVDKDRSPKWRPPRLQDLPADLVHTYFADLPAGKELGLGQG